jgi:hypothetical protein
MFSQLFIHGYRYQIEQMNSEDLLLCAFPYHHTKTFVRIIQLLKLDDDKSKWHWLNSAAVSYSAVQQKIEGIQYFIAQL